MQKFCNTCKNYKLVSNFNFKNKTKNKLSSKCRECHTLYLKFHYQINKSKYKNNARLSKKRIYQNNKILINNLKSQFGCKFCKEKDFRCLDFHHIMDNKISSISNMKNKSKTKIIIEICKCQVLCANCHRKLHY